MIYDPANRLKDLKTMYQAGLMSKEEYFDLKNKEHVRANFKGDPANFIPATSSRPETTFEAPKKRSSQPKKKSKFVSLIIWIAIIFLFNSFEGFKEFIREIFSMFN